MGEVSKEIREIVEELERELQEATELTEREYPDNVNHPPHYETGKFECIEVMEEALGREAVKDFCLCNAFKYLYRCTRKNGIEDLKKARWYLDKRIEMEEEE